MANSENMCLGMMVCVWQIVEQDDRNIGLNPTVELSQYQVKEIIALPNVVWFVKTWSFG